MKSLKYGFLISMVAALTACGGGGSSVETPASDGGDTGVPPVVLPPPSAASLIGTFVGACEPSGLVRQGGAAGPFVNEILKIENSAISANVAQVSTIFTRTFYASTDTQCAASPIGSARNASAGSQMTVDATVAVSFNGVDVFANQVTVTEGVVGGFASGGNISINGLTYPGNYFVTAVASKRLFYVADGSSILYSGVGAEDVKGYPTQPLTPAMTRQ